MEQDKFFDNNKHYYGGLTPSKFDYIFIDFISKHSNLCNLLDVGGGGGCFTKLCQEHFENSNLCIVDPSFSLLHKQELKNVKLIVGKIPDELNTEEKFDFIHIKDVLHHVTGSSIKKSKDLVTLSLINLEKNNLNQNAYILIQEFYYESYLLKKFTRTLIFYLLKMQNLLHVKIPAKEFIMGLDVCFYTRDEFKQIFKENGFKIIDYYEEKNEKNKIYKKLLLLKNWGRMCFVIQSKNRENDSVKGLKNVDD